MKFDRIRYPTELFSKMASQNSCPLVIFPKLTKIHFLPKKGIAKMAHPIPVYMVVAAPPPRATKLLVLDGKWFLHYCLDPTYEISDYYGNFLSLVKFGGQLLPKTPIISAGVHCRFPELDLTHIAKGSNGNIQYCTLQAKILHTF